VFHTNLDVDRLIDGAATAVQEDTRRTLYTEAADFTFLKDVSRAPAAATPHE